MKHMRKLLMVSFAFLSVSATVANAQNLPPKFGTPEGTNTLAATAGFIDILGVKLGMPAEAALAILKKNYPGSKITLDRTPDYESVWYRLERENPSHKWVYKINVDSNGRGDNITVGLSLPPSKQVVQTIGRTTSLEEPVAVENIVASLRKKYGQETYAFYEVQKDFLWVYDTQGNRVKPAAITENATRCELNIAGDSGGGLISLPVTRPYEPDTLKNNPCLSLVILQASIQAVSAAQGRGMNGQARSFQVVAYDWPLITSGAN